MKWSRRSFLGGMIFSGAGCAVSVGRSSDRDLGRLDSLAGRHGGRGWAAWQGGSRVGVHDPGYEGPILSITKCLAALAVTRAAGEGWIDPAERVVDTIPEWRGDARKSRITVGMLLQQTSGLESGVAALYRNPADKGRNAIQLRALDEPGTYFRYGPASSEVLAEVLQRKLVKRSESLESFIHRAVMSPIGLGSPDWRSDMRGRFFLSTGAELSVDELGRLGRAVAALLTGEDAHGLRAGDFSRVTRPSAANPMYGGGLWRNGGNVEIEVEDHLDPPAPARVWRSGCLSVRQPKDLVTLIGSSGRRVYIWPSEGLVIARHGVARTWSDREFLDGITRRGTSRD